MISKNNKKSTPNVYTMPFATPAVGMLFMKHGGQQELIDQIALHPDIQYNEKVDNYINKIKKLAMEGVQNEMLETSLGYDEEAQNIMGMMPMAQKGMGFTNSAYATIDAFSNAAKPKYNTSAGLMKFLAPTVFANAFNQNADPMQQYYVKSVNTKNLTAKDLAKGKTGMVVGSSDDEIINNPDGSVVVYKSDGTTLQFYNNQQFKQNYKPAEGKKVQATKELPTTLPGAASAETKETANPVGVEPTPAPTPTRTPTTIAGAAAAAGPAAAASQKEKVQNTGTPVVGDGYDFYRNLVPGGGQRGALMRGNTPEAFFAPNTVITSVQPTYRNNLLNFLRKPENQRPGSLKAIDINFGTLNPDGTVNPFGQGNNSNIPIIPNEAPVNPKRQARQAERAAKQEAKAAEISTKFENKAADILGQSGTPSDQTVEQRLANFPTTGFAPSEQGGGGYANTAQRLNYLANAGYTDEVAAELEQFGYKKGGALHKFLIKAVDGLTRQSILEDEVNITDPKKITYKQGNITDPKRITYELGKRNPFAAPAMLAGMNFIAGSLENRDAKQKQQELMERLSFDQMSTRLPGSEGDYAFNTGMFRPDQMVPVQFTGYNNTMSQFGGAFEKDNEYYLDDDTIQAILAAGGEIEYLD
jgi:hypothetical protein